MPHQLRYNPDSNCIELTVEGHFTMERLRHIAPEVAALSTQSGCLNILNDMSNATIDIPLSDIYSSPAEMDSSGISRTTRRALVVPADFTDGNFLETVTRNRGHNLKVFTDRKSALEWLQGY